MSSLTSNLFSTLLSSPTPSSQPYLTFSLRPSPQDSNVTLLHLSTHPTHAPPQYSLVATEGTKRNLLLYRGIPHPHPSSMIGTAAFHSFSSKTDLTVRGMPTLLKVSQLSGDFKLEYPPFGKLKWKVSKLMGSGLELCDGAGHRLARLRRDGLFGERKLEVLVHCDERFVEMVVLSGMAAREVAKVENEVTAEVVGAVAGA